MTLPDRIDTILTDDNFEIFSATVDGAPVAVQVFTTPLDDADAAAFRRVRSFPEDIDDTAIIDDDVVKHGKLLVNAKVISSEQIKDFDHDGILIASYAHKRAMKNKLIELNHDPNRIMTFFGATYDL